MNILIMAKYSTAKSGNFIASLLELSLKLRSQGELVYFLFPKDAELRSEWISWLGENGFPVAFLDDDKNSKSIIQDIQQYIQKWDINLIHCHFGFCLKEISLNLHKLMGVKLLVHDHMDYSPDKNVPVQYVKQWLMSLLYRKQGIGVVTVMEKKSRGYWFCKKKHVWYIPNGLSLKRNIKQSMNREEMRQYLNISNDSKLVLFLGWDMHRKGVDIAIRAIEKLHKTNPNVLLGFLGFGETPELSKCEWIKERTGLDPANTQWMRFLPASEDIFACHRAADVYLSASRREAFSYGLLEAISQNIPIVVSDIEGTSWALAYSKSSSYPTEDFSACAEEIEKSFNKRFDESNMDEMLSRYNIDSWCQEIIDIYHKMVE